MEYGNYDTYLYIRLINLTQFLNEFKRIMTKTKYYQGYGVSPFGKTANNEKLVLGDIDSIDDTPIIYFYIGGPVEDFPDLNDFTNRVQEIFKYAIQHNDTFKDVFEIDPKTNEIKYA